MQLLHFLRSIKKSLTPYQPLVEILISRGNLLHNLNQYKNQYPKLAFAPVIKSNAYGHGLIQIAKILDREDIAFFVVDSLYEAIILRNGGIQSRILIIGYTSTQNIHTCTLSQVAFTITSLEQLQEITQELRTTKSIHIKIDTGMHRQGILLNQIDNTIKIIKANPRLNLEGICSHFAEAGNSDVAFTRIQMEHWEKAVHTFKENFQKIPFFHIAATTGTHHSDQFSSNVARLGIGLYGMDSSSQTHLDLRPVLQMQSVISSIKTIPVGEYIGYDRTYKTEKTTTTATVPVGYFEGVDRRLSNCGTFKMNNHFCPILGTVSMNITSCDVSSMPEAKIGDRVIIISNHKEDTNSVENIAKLTHTIPYEILIHIPQHLRRTVI